ncbi:MAG TPA: small ribosomal subunit Rsm22 family protein [Mycobacteriales bacterium]|nr:small ribosomal subunit Rsm22 family protein [Mycobacteriales bacterium]
MTRAPATQAAAAQALAWTATALPEGWAPAHAVDVGSGTGATATALLDRWPAAALTCLEPDAAARALGQAAVPQAEWRAGDLRSAVVPPADLVTAAYCLDELGRADVDAAVDRLWAATREVLLIIEPGTPAGFALIREIRSRLIAAGATIAAPCPHDDACPMAGGDWCHSAVRVVRSAQHRSAKEGVLGHEDEKLAYVAASRLPVTRPVARVLRHPRYATKLVTLRTCDVDGALHDVKVPKSTGEAYKRARAVKWGDAWS